MNLEESNRIYQENKQKSTKKKGIIAGIVLCIIAIIICAIIIFVLQQVENSRFKMIVDGKEVTMSESFIIQDDEKNQYVNLKMLAAYTGYKYTQGDYIEVNEDKNTCFIENDYEVVSFKVDEKGFVKYIKNDSIGTVLDTENAENTVKEPNTQKNEVVPEEEKEVKFEVKSKDGEKEVFKSELPIIYKEEQIYIPFDIVNIACNTDISLTEKRLTINSLDTLVQTCLQYAPRLGYTSMSSVYENIRTIPNGMLVVGDGSKYGVVNLQDGKIILGVKYDDLKYIQNQNKFYIYVDNKVGLVDADGTTIISPKNYDSIETFDVDKNIYLVKENGKYGLLDFEGNPILHTDYDQIGISNIEDFDLDFNNENLWFDKIVAIKQGSVWGLYNIERKEVVLDVNYSGFGYVKQTTDIMGEESVLTVPKETGVEGVVIALDGHYGIFDIKIQEVIIPCACSRVYSITSNGKAKYYMEFSGYQLEMREYFEANGQITVDEEENKTEDTTE